MIRWLRLWPTILSAVLVGAALAVSSAPLPRPAPAPEAAPPSAHRPPPEPRARRITGGNLSGILPGDRRVFHHADLTVVRRVDPLFPPTALEAGLPDDRCVVWVYIDRDGVPTEARPQDCARPFAAAAEQALLQWRWAPRLDEEGRPVTVKTAITVRFVRERPRSGPGTSPHR